MRRETPWPLMLAGVLLFLSLSTASWAETIWVSPLEMRQMRLGFAPDLVITQSSPSVAVVVSTTEAGILQFYGVPVSVSSKWLFESVTVCYQLSNVASNINTIRLAIMTTPDFAGVFRDWETAPVTTVPVCHTTSPMEIPVQAFGIGQINFRTDFVSTNHTVEVGGIAVNLIPSGTTDVGDNAGTDGAFLGQNFPNPFRGTTMIEYEVPSLTSVDIRVYNVAGRMIRSLAIGEQGPGIQRVFWDGEDDTGVKVPAGIYFYRVRIGDKLGTRQMVFAP